jgi:hypothetical protein
MSKQAKRPKSKRLSATAILRIARQVQQKKDVQRAAPQRWANAEVSV